jgi:hypothetical protein
MKLLLAALALVPSQDAPRPVRVPGHVDVRTTLYDGFAAYELLVDAFESADSETRVAFRAHARADRALEDWQRGERRAAVESWTWLALELQGDDGELDLLAAALRMECIDSGRVTRTRRGCFTFGESSGATRVRVRALFPLPELATRRIEVELATATSVVTPAGREDFPTETIGQLAIEFDSSGRLARVDTGVPVGPFDVRVGIRDHCECDVELRASGRSLDRIRVVNFIAAAFAPFPWTPDLDTIETMGPVALQGAYRALWSRHALGVEAASLERSREFLFGAAEPVRARARQPRWYVQGRPPGCSALSIPEDVVLKDGRSPYADREWTTAMGPYWRTHVNGRRDVPAWTLVPKAGGDSGLPVIVVLHEVGFDEGWAVRLAGGGALFEEADRHGFAVLAPPNAELEADPSAFTALIDSLALDVSIDRTRVYVLAPASAAPLARRLAELHPTLVASTIVLGEVNGPDGAPLAGVGRVLGLERAIASALDGLDQGGRK